MSNDTQNSLEAAAYNRRSSTKRFPGTDIPDDIMMEVGALLTGGLMEKCVTVHQVAARVMMHERERCARLVEGLTENPQECTFIANAIRSPGAST